MVKLLLKGIASYIPLLSKLTPQTNNTGGTVSARYCYSVWLRHLTMAYKNGLTDLPEVVAELGPGDSIGTGLAALLCGVNKYFALDVIEYAQNARNLQIFNNLIELFQKREKIPDVSEFPALKPYLNSYEFPHHILTDQILNKSLAPDRIESIRHALLNSGVRNTDAIQISYFVPWHDSGIIKDASVDMVFSQAVLEYVDDLSSLYEILWRWLKPGGFMSHQIDFKCDGLMEQWNGHWTYSDFVWKYIKGEKPYFINRQPHSTHIDLLRKSGFSVVCDIKTKSSSILEKKHLAVKFKNLSDDDLTTSGAFIQSVKRNDSNRYNSDK